MKKTIMNHSLAKALMESSMQHFDDGGTVVPTTTTNAGSGPATTASGNAGFLGTLFGQNNYNANLAPTQTSDYSGVINNAAGNATAGYGNANQIQTQQQGLANQLLAQSQGAGPNPALAQLNNTTGQNAAQASALIGSARGSGANAGLAARSAAMAGTNANQTAAGQAASMNAQQQLAAEGQLAGVQQNIAGNNIAEQGVNANLVGTAGNLQNAQNNTSVANTGMVQQINSGVAGGNAKSGSGILGGIASGVGSIFGLAEGGEIPDHLHQMAKIYHPNFAAKASNFTSGGPVSGNAKVSGNSLKNDTVPAMLSPGEIVLPRSVTQSPKAAKKAADFVQALHEKDGSDHKEGYAPMKGGKAKDLKSRVERLEKMFAGGMA